MRWATSSFNYTIGKWTSPSGARTNISTAGQVQSRGSSYMRDMGNWIRLEWIAAKSDTGLDSVGGGVAIRQRGFKWAAVSHCSGAQGPSCAYADYRVEFVPIPGAAGFQVGNPCALAICPLLASLEIFEMTSMSAVRQKSITLTKYLEELLQRSDAQDATGGATGLYRIITPANPAERGAQLSMLLKPGLLEGVMADLEAEGVVVDERKPDVIRVAPAPLYNSFSDVWDFVEIFKRACVRAEKGLTQHREGPAAFAGIDKKGWSQIK